MQYAYLILTIPFLLILAWIFWRRPDLRRPIIRVGILGGLLGIISEFWYYQDYWQPETLLGKGVPSLEDFLFGFGVVGLGAALPLYILKQPWPKIEPGRSKRLGLIILGTIALFVVFTTVLKLNSMLTTYIFFAVIIELGLVRWPKLIKPMCISGGLLIIIGSLAYTLTWLILSRNQTDISTIYLINGEWWAPVYFGFLPLTEIIWYGLWGMAATALPYILNLQKTK